MMIASARPRPICALLTNSDAKAIARNSTDITTAEPVTMPAVLVMPSRTAISFEPVSR